MLFSRWFWFLLRRFTIFTNLGQDNIVSYLALTASILYLLLSLPERKVQPEMDFQNLNVIMSFLCSLLSQLPQKPSKFSSDIISPKLHPTIYSSTTLASLLFLDSASLLIFNFLLKLFMLGFLSFQNVLSPETSWFISSLDSSFCSHLTLSEGPLLTILFKLLSKNSTTLVLFFYLSLILIITNQKNIYLFFVCLFIICLPPCEVICKSSDFILFAAIFSVTRKLPNCLRLMVCLLNNPPIMLRSRPLPAY